jgi:hypothetical protein
MIPQEKQDPESVLNLLKKLFLKYSERIASQANPSTPRFFHLSPHPYTAL